MYDENVTFCETGCKKTADTWTPRGRWGIAAQHDKGSKGNPVLAPLQLCRSNCNVLWRWRSIKLSQGWLIMLWGQVRMQVPLKSGEKKKMAASDLVLTGLHWARLCPGEQTLSQALAVASTAASWKSMLSVPDLPASSTAVRQARSFTHVSLSLSLPLSLSFVRTLLKRISRVAKFSWATHLLWLWIIWASICCFEFVLSVITSSEPSGKRCLLKYNSYMRHFVLFFILGIQQSDLI